MNVVKPPQAINTEIITELMAQIKQMSTQLAQLQSVENDKLITIKEVSRLTGLSRNTILKYTELGKFKAQVVELSRYKKYLFNRGEVLLFAERQNLKQSQKMN